MHIYKDRWDTPIDKILYCEREIGNNRSDSCAVCGSKQSYIATKEGALLI